MRDFDGCDHRWARQAAWLTLVAALAGACGDDAGGTTGDDDDDDDMVGDCTAGERRCAGDAVETCVDGAFGDPVSCSTGESCSLGVCEPVEECDDECVASGTTQCAGDAVVECGELDSDDCLDLGNPTPCPAGTVCSNGACEESCTNECEASDAECVGAAASRVCGDFDGDSCRDWGPPSACPSGEVCEESTAQCTAVECEDECDPETFPWTCASGGFTACVTGGDSDPCLESATLGCDQCGSGSPFEDAQCLECCP